MPSSRWKRFLKRHWLDLVATIALWSFVSHYLLGRILANTYSFEAQLAWLAPPILFPLWVFIRLGPLTFKLADPERRAHIAVTPMPASEYLSSHLKVPLLMTSAPFSIIIVVMILSLSGGEIEVAVFAFAYLSYAAFFIYMAYVGILAMLCRLCKKCSSVAVFAFLYYCILSYGIIIIIAIFDLILIIGALPLAILLAFIYIPFSVMLAINYARTSWGKACAAYYQFE